MLSDDTYRYNREIVLEEEYFLIFEVDNDEATMVDKNCFEKIRNLGSNKENEK